ncbi:PTS system mannose/fructose/N-acetylgalactosamine-transporter subunit IIB [Lacticaseibacillus rhamnosus]|uniref:PTS system mannose/fructose/N-acetylgalactosamine-transporter subunit IIB n=1 Tax=Lacticaseibacillus rhamnosus TaxID=47715 RepID=UPI0023E0D8DD|nr:PTS sugar transporter subunit IIB [Lacticaseibacillus rhamnosus]MDF3335693.1 PTS sugar transporter subunit IIB [Lacticaseibacillus rhamnosus]
MTIVNVRIDGRLIHGQVARIWTGALQATRIMVVGEAVAHDDLEKTALKLAKPSEVSLSILPPDRAATNFLNHRYDSQRVFIVTREPEALLELANAGVAIKEINIGNMPSGEGRSQIYKSVSIDDKDAATFKELSNKGIRLYHQMVPNDSQEDFLHDVKEKMG